MIRLESKPTQFTELNTVLTVFVDELKSVLEDELVVVYLTGSFAQGAGDEHSDVDFMVIIENPLTKNQLADLQTMHLRVFDYPSEWAKHLEGSYFPREIAKQQEETPTPLWYLDNGATQLVLSTHDNEYVFRWVTREHGITLYGDDPKTLLDPIPVDAMKRDVVQIMHDWGDEIINQAWDMNNRWAQPFAVLMYCRMLYTLEHGTIESKQASADWAIQHLPSEWHDLIQSAWDDRPNPSEKVYLQPSQADIDNTIAFIRFAISESNS